MAEESQNGATEVKNDQPDYANMTEDQQWAYLAEHGAPPKVESKEENSDDDDLEEASAKSEEKKDESEKKEGESEENVDDEKEKDSKKEEYKEEEEEAPADIDALIKAEYGEEYEINSKEELDQILSVADKILEENDTLKTQLDEAKKAPKEPEFSNEAEKSAYNFIKGLNLDPSHFSDKLETWAKIQGMEVDKMEAKNILEEEFVLTHPELTRNQAQRKFERVYHKNYVVDKERFDSDKEYEEAKEDAEIDLTSDLARAKKYLKDKQTEFKTKPVEKAEDKKAEENTAITKGIEQNVKRVEEYGKEFKSLTYAPTDKDEDNFTVEFNAEQRKEIQTFVASMVKNAGLYSEKGEININFDIEEAFTRASRFLHGDTIEAEMWKHAVQAVSIKRVEEVAKVKPDRKSKTGSIDVTKMNEDAQWDMHIKKKNGTLVQ